MYCAILPWLGSRNTCPVCRFELEMDDAEYEEERKKRGSGMGMERWRLLLLRLLVMVVRFKVFLKVRFLAF